MNKLKKEGGFTQVDIAISITILILFVTLIASLFYNSYTSSTKADRDAEATVFLTKILQSVDLIEYDDLEDTNLGLIAKINEMDIEKISAKTGGNSFQESEFSNQSTPYIVHVEIVKYNETMGNRSKEDLIKIITINISYKNKKGEPLQAQRLKTKEIEFEDSLGIMPQLLEGMTPLSYEDENQATTKYSTNWFDYSKEKVALISLNDNLTIDSNGKITNLGSEFLYIPRFAYKIFTDEQENEKIDIKFINTDNKSKDGSAITVYEETTSLDNGKYYLPSIFTQENIELEGIWLGKYLCKNDTDRIEDSNIYITGDEEYSLLTYTQEQIQKMSQENNCYGISENTNIKKEDTDLSNMINKLQLSDNYSFIVDEIEDRNINNINAFRIYLY